MTESIINLHFLAESQPSICIPRVFSNILEPRIREVFNDLNLGKIRKIDIVERNNEKGEPFKRVFIHFEKWFWNDNAKAARGKLISGKEIKIVYDNPWFWKVSASKWTPSADELDKGNNHKTKARIEFEDGEKVDEFGRDLSLKQDRKFKSKPEEPRGQDTRRSGPIYTEQRRFEQKNNQRGNGLRRNAQGIPIAPTLQRKAERSKAPLEQPSEEINSSRATILDMDKPAVDQFIPVYEAKLAVKRRNIKLKKAKEIVLLEEDMAKLKLEEGEVDETGNLSEKDKKECEELYGDLM